MMQGLTTPASTWRSSQKWSQYVGKRGVVVASTFIRVSAPEQAAFTPYSFVIVEVEGERLELMGAGHEKLEIGDSVQCVLRKTEQPSEAGLLVYGIKVVKV